jgi:hypothetical protein
LGAAHFLGVAFVVEEDEAFDPDEVAFFGVNGIMVEADEVADLIEQFLGGW